MLGHPGQSWSQVFLLSGYQFRQYLRSRRFVLMMSLVAAVGAILIGVVAHYRPSSILADASTYYDQLWASGVTFVVIVAGVIYGGDAIAGEFQNKTGYFLMGLPVRRATVYAGKYLAALLASVIAVAAYAVLLVANGAYYFGLGAFSAAFVLSFGLALLYLFALLGTTFLFSSLFKTSTYATLVVAVLFLFGFTLLEDLISGLVKIEPWFIISYASPVIGYPFLASIPVHTMRFGGGGPLIYNPTYAEGIAILLGYFVLTAIAGLFLFEREEFT